MRGTPATTIARVLTGLGRLYDTTRFARTHGPDPFRILIGCIISLRTKDEVTYPATARLFRRVSTPRGLVSLGEATIARAIFPAGFYRRKARQIREISRPICSACAVRPDCRRRGVTRQR